MSRKKFLRARIPSKNVKYEPVKAAFLKKELSYEQAYNLITLRNWSITDLKSVGNLSFEVERDLRRDLFPASSIMPSQVYSRIKGDFAELSFVIKQNKKQLGDYLKNEVRELFASNKKLREFANI